MLSLHEQTPNFNKEILDQLDLAEWESEYHWSQFEQLTLEAQRHLQCYDAAVAQRRQLSHRVSSVSSSTEMIMA